MSALERPTEKAPERVERPEFRHSVINQAFKLANASFFVADIKPYPSLRVIQDEYPPDTFVTVQIDGVETPCITVTGGLVALKRVIVHGVEMNGRSVTRFLKRAAPVGTSFARIDINNPEIDAELFEPLPDPPEDWLSITTLADRFGRSGKVAGDAVRVLLSEDPSRKTYVKKFQSKAGPTEFYAPEFIRLIGERLAVMGENAPEGWKTPATLGRMKLAGKTEQTIKNACDDLLKSHPEWKDEHTGLYFSNIGKTTYYSPFFITQIEALLAKKEKAPDAWKAIRTLGAERLGGRTKKTIQKVIDALLEENPELQKDHAKEFYATSGFTTYYSPDLIQMAQERMNSMERAPEGWITLKALGKQKIGGRSETGLKPLIDRLLVERPELADHVKEYWSATVKTPHFSPIFAEALKKEIAKQGAYAPEGWQTGKALEPILKTSRPVIADIAAELLAENPKLKSGNVDDFFSNSGDTSTYYSPSFVALIKRRLESRREGDVAPTGWLSLDSIAADRKHIRSKPFIRGEIQSLIDENRDFAEKETGTFFDSRKINKFTYYSPRFVQTLDERLAMRAKTVK